ncbi:MAG: Bax inhibitor-1/YccA family protein [Chloroflexi bacterium]|nr:MAG: Bax inhibitor-1/YccA family protein [Chloroflexota bacterium]
MSWNPSPTSPLRSDASARPTTVPAALLTQAFIWMFAGLLLTAGVAAVVQTSSGLLEFTKSNFMLLIIGQLVVVFAINLGINRLGATAALGLFFVYAAALGLTVGLIVSAYTTTSVTTAFLSAAAMFGGAALYGATTKRSLVGIGGILSMAVIGLIVALVINIFLPSGPFGLLLSVAGVIIFTALTAYNVQRIQAGDLVARYGSVEKAAVIGALALYLDFVNIFLFLLRIFGSRR